MAGIAPLPKQRVADFSDAGALATADDVSASQVASGTLALARIPTTLTGKNADQVDGNDASAFATAGHSHAGIDTPVKGDWYLSANQTLSTSYATIAFNTENDNVGSFTNSSGEISLPSGKELLILTHCSINQTSGNNRVIASIKLQCYNGSSWDDIGGKESDTYSRNTADGEGTLSLSYVADSDTYTKVRIQAKNDDGGITSVLQGGKCSIGISSIGGG